MTPNRIGTIGDYSAVAIFIVLSIVFVVGTLLSSYAVRRRGLVSEQLTRLSTYECGESPVGEAMNQFHVGYYIFALIFVVFDIDTVFLAPWALVLRNLEPGLRMLGFMEGLTFVLILAVGLVYAWKKGVLKWI